MEQKTSNLFDLQVDPQSQNYLSETAKWAKFISIIGFIFCGLLTVVLLISAFAGTSYFEGWGIEAGSSSGQLGASEIIILVVMIMVIFLTYLYLFRFAARMQTALRSNDQASLTAAFGNLKTCYRIVGIITIVFLSLYILGIVLKIINETMNNV
ncbi:MAG TPA: DUF5362 family protein [Chitinophagaceae bacterium]|nr:DUF5362 family protein [Chitinophagaceae bacterium]